jgi:hypothetical protein
VSETAGTAGALQVAPSPRGPLQTATRPIGLNGIFLQYENVRWFAAGPAVEYVASRFRQVGQYRGFPVYADNDQRGTIYIALVKDAPGLLAPYRSR